MHAKKIQGDKVTLKPMAVLDANEIYLSWLQDPEVIYAIQYPSKTLEELRAYVSRKISDSKVAFWSIHTDKMVGTIKLEPIDFENKFSNFGIMLGDKSIWGLGIGTEATNLVTQFAFDQLRLHYVELGVLKTNLGAIKAYEKAGFDIFNEKSDTLIMKKMNPKITK